MSAISTTALASTAYVGRVIHTRSRPARHTFAYTVFGLVLDIDEIDVLARRFATFSRNRFNLLSFYDADHGARDGRNIGVHVREMLNTAGFAHAGAQITLLCYPRILGFVFNPLSVYFCRRADASLAVIVYEVSNTFGERKSYIIPVSGTGAGVISQTCDKEMYVSPFTSRHGRYEFRVLPPNERVFVGVDFRDSEGLLLKTSFGGERRALSTLGILRLVVSHPLMMVKVVAGIHFEAVRLWMKGVPLVERHTSPSFSFSIVPVAKRDQ